MDFFCLCFYYVLDFILFDFMIGLKFLLEIIFVFGRLFEVVW